MAEGNNESQKIFDMCKDGLFDNERIVLAHHLKLALSKEEGEQLEKIDKFSYGFFLIAALERFNKAKRSLGAGS